MTCPHLTRYRSGYWRTLCTAVLLAAVPASGVAQIPARIDPGSTASPVHTPAAFDSVAGHWSNTLTVGVVASFMWAGVEIDEQLRAWAQKPRLQGSGVLGGVTDVFDPLGGRVPLAVVGVSYLASRAVGSGTATDISQHVGVASLAAVATTGVLKGMVGRGRPYHLGEEDVFDPGQGLRGNTHFNSFPSGHTTLAFALATSLSGEVTERWPRLAGLSRVVGYSAAALTGFSRVYKDKHWGTDVVAGALIGHWVAERVLERAHDESALGERWSPFVGPGPGGGLSYGISLALD